MPGGTSRFSIDGTMLHHYMGTSTFANYTVPPEIAVAKIRKDAPFDKFCYIGCGVTTGIGAGTFDMGWLVEMMGQNPSLVQIVGAKLGRVLGRKTKPRNRARSSAIGRLRMLPLGA